MFLHLTQYLVRIAFACCAFVWLVAVADASEIESFDVIRMNSGPAAARDEGSARAIFWGVKSRCKGG